MQMRWLQPAKLGQPSCETRVSLCAEGVRVFWRAVQGQAKSESDGSEEAAVMAWNLNKADCFRSAPGLLC